VLEGAVLEGAVLEGAVLEGAVLEGAVLEGAVLEGAVLDAGGATVERVVPPRGATMGGRARAQGAPAATTSPGRSDDDPIA
jgi:uncharacterized protein YjbI with pentapeptide repeats